MDYLSLPIVLEILNRLNDSTDLARCRPASKTLDDVAREVRYVHLQCSHERYLKSRSPEKRFLITPFKTIFKKLIFNSGQVESVRIGVAKPVRKVLDDESDDLYLTDVNFVNEWLPEVGERLRSISISDFWVQSCWRRSEVLSLISSYCHSLVELEVKNAWLSVDGLNPMPNLTSLTLECITLGDEDLNMLNDCFPSLQILNLIRIGGLVDPMIRFLKLKTCQWTVPNTPTSLTILAPNLLTLELRCVKPSSLVIEAPLLTYFHLTLNKTIHFQVREFKFLNTLHLESTNLCTLFSDFPFGRTVENLTMDSPKRVGSVETTKFRLAELFNIFPNMRSLTLGAGAWAELEMCLCDGGKESGAAVMNGLREIIGYLVLHDAELTLSFIFSLLDKCSNLSTMAVLIHRDVDSSVVSSFISRCVTHCSTLRWRWGTWKEGMKDSWLSNGNTCVAPKSSLSGALPKAP